jgi:Xaa-Pro dipeptidase
MKEAEVGGEHSRILWKDRIDSVRWQAVADERASRFRHAIPAERAIQKYLMLNVNARKWGLVATVTRAGTSLTDILPKICELYERHGYRDEWNNHHQGGAQGFCNRDYLMKPDSREKVLADQCFCWNPSISGTKSEDALIARKDGPLFIAKPLVFPTLTIDYERQGFARPALLER